MKKRNKRLSGRMRHFLQEEEGRCKPSTIAGYRTSLGHLEGYLDPIRPCLSGRQKIAHLTQADLRGYLSFLNEKDLVPYSKVNYLLSAKKYLQWEVEQGTFQEELLEVLDRRQLPKVPEYLPKPLSAEKDRLLRERLHASPSPYAPLFLLLRQTGLRISELINLTPDCVVTTFKNEKYLKVPLGKMNTERLVPLTEESLALIERIRTLTLSRNENRNDHRLIGLSGSIPRVYARLDRIFRRLHGHLIDQDKPVTFHRLRHTFATSLLTGGVSLVSLMKLLGHRRIEMTLRYAKVTPTHLRNEYLKAIKILENQSAPLETRSAGGEANHHPSEILHQLSAFLNTAALLPVQHKKNILLRLSRLKDTLAQIPFSKNFTLYGA